ncbi:hypothetical protein ACI48D_24860 [Massilia sp. LXY-6]|uniref:hypothetical protein n=1 Tax=Massilia sp. LXY-6 TaxID=3379823 RepID=UPI003EE16952
MPNLNWYKSLEQCVTLDDIRAQWHKLLEQNQMMPANPVPGYHDAMLSFVGRCALSPELKLAAVLALGSAFDFDFRLALGALAEQTMEDGVPWPESVSASVSDNGPCLQVTTGDAWLGAFIAGRLAGLRETMSHDGTRPDDWKAGFWNAFLKMACRHAAQIEVRLALQHGADPVADDYAAVRAAARGMHLENNAFCDYGLPNALDADYGNTLLQLVESGLPAREMLAISLRAAAEVDNTAMLDFLRAHGADIRADGDHALAAAARHLAFGAFEWLLEQGADIETHNGAVLDAAVATLTEGMVEEVLMAGANPRVCTNQVICTTLGPSPYDLYPEKSDFSEARADIFALLLRHGARPAGPEVVDALRQARDGRRVIEATLERGGLCDDAHRLLDTLAAQAFGQSYAGQPPA